MAAIRTFRQRCLPAGPARLLRMQGMLLKVQAQLEPDRARQPALEDAAAAAFDELDTLEKP